MGSSYTYVGPLCTVCTKSLSKRVYEVLIETYLLDDSDAELDLLQNMLEGVRLRQLRLQILHLLLQLIYHLLRHACGSAAACRSPREKRELPSPTQMAGRQGGLWAEGRRDGGGLLAQREFAEARLQRRLLEDQTFKLPRSRS